MTTIADELVDFLKSVRLADLFSEPYFYWPYQEHYKLDYLNHQVSLMCSLSSTNIQNKTIRFGQIIYSNDIYFIEKEFNVTVELFIEPGNSYYIIVIENQNTLKNEEMKYYLKIEEGRATLYDLIMRVDNMIPLTSNLALFKLEDYTNKKFSLNPDFFTDSQSMMLIEAAYI